MTTPNIAESTAASNPAGRTWTLTIPAPAKWLNANDRVDRRRGTPARRAWRDAAHWHAKAAHLPHIEQAYMVATLHFTDNRRRDAHNFYPTIKACVDGLIDYGLLPDDSAKYLIGPDIRLGPPIPRAAVGQLVLTIREAVSADA